MSKSKDDVMDSLELRKLRRAAGVSREALAAIMGCEVKSIGRKERGESRITIAEEFFLRHKLKAKL